MDTGDPRPGPVDCRQADTEGRRRAMGKKKKDKKKDKKKGKKGKKKK